MNKKEAHIQMQEELERLQQDLASTWLDQSLPRDWAGLDFWHPMTKHQTRVTLRLDNDMLAWFRKLGPGYGRRINMVLRIYYCGLLSGEIQAHPGDKTVPRVLNEVNRILEGKGHY